MDKSFIMENKYVFISYSSKNKASADGMRDLLRDNGINTWMAPGDIPAGSTYAKVITRALKNCACFVLMLSEDAQNSTWVAKEVERAVNYRRPIIPVQIEDVVLNDEFELYISTDQLIAIPKIDIEAKEVKKLIESLNIYLSLHESVGTYEDNVYNNDNRVFFLGSRNNACERYSLESINIIGRDPRKSTIKLEGSLVSSLHAWIKLVSGKWFIRDLNTINGTFLNGNRIDSGVDIEIKEGDFVKFGDREFTIHNDVSSYSKDDNIELPKQATNDFKNADELQKIYIDNPSALAYSIIKKIDDKSEIYLPRLLSYYQLLGITDISQLKIDSIRDQNDVTVSLSVPIGKNICQEIIYLDLHPKGDGPNGVISGIAETGKSEFLSTLCLSLCLFFTKEEICINIIDDFLPQKFAGLPHLGKCAHFNKSEIDSFIHAIDEEIERRRLILKNNSVSNMYQYLKERKACNCDMEAMPHMIVIVDSVDLLMNCSPDAIKKLKEWGSHSFTMNLGIHIVLTSQIYSEFNSEMLRLFGDFKIGSWITNDSSANYPGRIYMQSHARTKSQEIQLAYCGASFKDEYIDHFKGFFTPKREDEEIIDLIRRYEMD